MKILFWTDGFWPRIGGIETQAFHFVEELQKRGHQCLVLAQKDSSNTQEDEVYKGIQIKRFFFNKTLVQCDINALRSIRNYLEWALKEFKVDIVHLNLNPGWGSFIFVMFKTLFSLPIVLTCHSPFVYDKGNIHTIKPFYAAASHICCVSKWVLAEMEKLLPEMSSKLRLIYNGLSMPEILPTPLSFTSPTLLLLGRLAPEKGFGVALKALALLKKEKIAVNLLLAGEGTERASLEQSVAELNLTDSVQFVGPIRREAIPSLMNQATVVVVPSDFESFGLVALEAMQMERPVIASNVGGLLEVVSNGATGLLVPPQDPVALAQAIRTLFKNPARTRQMGVEGRKKAIRQFTLDQHVTQYENLYRESL